jgi:branched-chain amino acid transport system ATP-binding protein
LVHPLLEVTQLNVFYGDAQAIWEVSFQVEKEKMVALVGANGAGKTTVLNTISAVLRPSKGRISFSGQPLAHHKPEDVVTMGISHVPEGRRLFSRLTVLENLELGAFPARARPFFHESLDRVFRLFPVLKQRIHQQAGSLSGGEQQMLAMARAIMAKPVLLMLDEPSLGLAPVMVKLMFQIIQALNKEGATVLLVEQNVHQTLEIADYVYVIKTGRMELEGHGQDLIRNPDFQRAYLGMLG